MSSKTNNQSSNRKPISDTAEYKAFNFAKNKAQKNGWRFPFRDFAAFMAHVHARPSDKHSLARVSDGLYRWVERKPDPATDPQAFLRWVVRQMLDQSAVHGLVQFLPERDSFNHARSRCTRPSDKAWKWYGELGVQFKFKNLKEWCIELGPRPTEKHSVDRINPEGSYEIGQIRWATPQQQANNTRRQRRNNGTAA